jgi:peroxiredoxin
MELYNTTSYHQDEVIAVIKTTKEKTKFPENRVVAEDMVSLLTKLKPGTMAPEFTLMNRDQKYLSLKSLRGKPVVLCFWTTYCEGCLAEMDLMKPLFDKYRENVHFVSVSADKYFSKMLFFINLKKDYVWTFVNIGDQSEVLKDYDVRTYPLFVLIDKEGKINKYPAGQPSAGLELEIQKILE